MCRQISNEPERSCRLGHRKLHQSLLLISSSPRPQSMMTFSSYFCIAGTKASARAHTLQTQHYITYITLVKSNLGPAQCKKIRNRQTVISVRISVTSIHSKHWGDSKTLNYCEATNANVGQSHNAYASYITRGQSNLATAASNAPHTLHEQDSVAVIIPEM